MNQNDKSILNPKLRFPEFRNTPGWEKTLLKDVLTEHGLKSDGESEVHSVSVHKGVINQKEHLGRSFAAADTSNYNLAKPHDIIYTKSPTGDFPFGVVKQNKLSYNVIVSPLYGVFKPTNRHIGYILDAYFESRIRTNNYLAPIIKKGAKNTILIANETFISKGLYIPLNEKEQQKIADCLISIDELIAAQAKKVEGLKTYKKGLMEQLFPREDKNTPRLRFQEFRDAPGWKKKTLKETAEINPVNEELPDSFIYIDLDSVEAGELTKKRKISREDAPSRAQRLIKRGDIIYQVVRPYQRNNLLCDFDGDNYVASTGYAQLRAYECNRFLYQCIHTDTFVNQVIAKCSGSNYPAINSSHLAEISLKIPDTVSEQQKIADCLSTLDIVIFASSQKLKDLKAHKKGLMQQLFPSPEVGEA